MSEDISAREGLEHVSFQPGEFLFKEGEVSRHFYIIREGQVEIFKMGIRGEEIPLAVIEDGQSIGEFAMIDDSPRSATARCLTSVRAVKVNEQAYRYMLEKLPEWALAMMEGLIHRIRATNDILKRQGIVDQGLTQKIASMEFDEEITTTVNLELEDLTADIPSQNKKESRD